MALVLIVGFHQYVGTIHEFHRTYRQCFLGRLDIRMIVLGRNLINPGRAAIQTLTNGHQSPFQIFTGDILLPQ